MTKTKESKMKTVVVFGVFDGLHPGHLFFLKEARKHGDELVVIVARDEAVKKLKGRFPVNKETSRAGALRRCGIPSRVFIGDKKEGEYKVLSQIHPRLICLGYDQQALENDLKERMKSGAIPNIRTLRISAHYPDEYHSSIISGLKRDM